MINYDICVTPDDKYISITISNKTRIVNLTNSSSRAMVIFQDVDDKVKYINVTKERFLKLVLKTTGRILCTVQ